MQSQGYVSTFDEQIHKLEHSNINSTFFGQHFNQNSSPFFYTKFDEENSMQIVPQNIQNIWNNDSQRVNFNIHAQPFIPTQNSDHQNMQGSSSRQCKPFLGR